MLTNKIFRGFAAATTLLFAASFLTFAGVGSANAADTAAASSTVQATAAKQPSQVTGSVSGVVYLSGKKKLTFKAKAFYVTKKGVSKKRDAVLQYQKKNGKWKDFKVIKTKKKSFKGKYTFTTTKTRTYRLLVKETAKVAASITVSVTK
ncbi:hypothetical protein BH09ACT10_BH09ACT10_16750 [soil metagenome]